MKKFRFLNCLLCTLLSFQAVIGQEEIIKQKTPVDFVNMLIGTTGSNKTEYGGLTPNISTPFGMTKWCAATRQNMISKTMYHYDDSLLIGYMGTHQPVIWMGDYGFLTLLPQVDNLKINVQERAVKFSHNDEIATPYYYKNSFTDSNNKKIVTQITATSRCSFFKISYPKNGEAIMFLEATRENNPNEGAEGYIEIFPKKKEIHIYNKDHQEDNHLGPTLKNFKGFYVLKFDQTFTDWGTWQEDTITTGNRIKQGKHIGGYVKFKSNVSDVQLRIGSSFISFEQAETNLQNEIPDGTSFDKIKEETKKEWNERLSKIAIKTNNSDDRALFYTMYFRTLQYPREITEYGKYYSAFDDKVHEGNSYNAFSLWDTFRAQNPWLQIVAPKRVDEMMQSLIQMFQQGGWMPKWPNLTYTNSMIGTHGDVVIADAYINGFRNYDIQTAYSSMMRNAFIPPLQNDDWKPGMPWTYEARAGLPSYLKQGYVAKEATRQSVSRTLEFALDDYCIAQVAKELGKTEDYKLFMERSKNYKNLFNPETGFFQAKNLDGSWGSDRDAFTEGGKWTYLFCVMQDVPGLIELIGGKENFVNKLDQNFDEGHYRHDNEPGHHYAYLYDYCNMLEKTQVRIRPIIHENYKNSVDGLSGNDDAGQMSAWYLFSALGFYPVTPAANSYAIGIPYFEEINLTLPKNKKLVIKANGVSDTKNVLKVVRLNGVKLNEPFVKINELMEGGILEFSEQ